MEDKEKEVHHTLRQHFSDQKFSSKVKITYADQKEEVAPYKSRYNTGVNAGEANANRVKNFHNSNVFKD